MGELYLKDVHATIGGVNLSDHIRQITISISADVRTNTAMGSDWATRLAGGVKDWTLSVEFNQDFAADSVDDTLFANIGEQMTFVGRPTSAAKGAANPELTGNAILQSYSPIDGEHGEEAKSPGEWVANGPLTRATS